MKDPHRFSDLTVLELRQYLARADSVLIPLGIIEQHGHHLPTWTDALVAEALCKRLAEELDILYVPCLYTQYSGGCLPGTINFNPATLLMCLRDMCTSLAQQGFRNQFIVIGHGGSENLTILRKSLPLMIRENPAFVETLVALFCYWQYSDKYADSLRQGEFHASSFETSLILHLRPDLVTDTIDTDAPETMAAMRESPDYYQRWEKPCDAPEVLPRVTQKDEVRVGVMGNPHNASAAFGKVLFDEAVEGMTARIREFLATRTSGYVDVEPELDEMVLL